MPPGVSEDLDDSVRTAIYHRRRLGESRLTVDEARYLKTGRHPVEIAAAGVLELRNHVERGQPRRRLALLDRQLAAYPPAVFVQDLAVEERSLTGDVDGVAAYFPRQIGGEGGRGFGQCNAQFLKALFDPSGPIGRSRYQLRFGSLG